MTGDMQNMVSVYEQLDSLMHDAIKKSNSFCRKYKNAVYEEDMDIFEPIVFNGTTGEFLELIGPLLLSSKWKVDGTHEVSRFIRALVSMVRIRYDPQKDYLQDESLLNAAREYIDRHRNE